MIRTLEKYPLLFICIIVAVMLLPNIDVLDISIMEARNYITAREMVTGGVIQHGIWIKKSIWIKITCCNHDYDYWLFCV
jgi:hypothetical protein